MIRLFARNRARRTLAIRMAAGESLRVLHIIGTLNRGGAEVFLLNLVRSSVALPMKVDVLCYGDEPFDLELAFTALGAQVHRIPRGSSVLQQRRAIHAIGPDIVHAHTDLNAGIAMIAAKSANICLTVAHSHNSVFGKTGSSLWRRVYEFAMLATIRSLADLRLACGDDAGRAMFGELSYKVQQNGVDIEKFQFNLEKRDALRTGLLPCEISDSQLVLGVVARLEPVKNHEFIVRVLAKLLPKLPSAKLVLVGRGSCEAPLLELTQNLGVAPSVHLLGVRDDIADLLNAFDAVALPSLHEGFPVSMVEAQVNGVPIVVSDQVDPAAMLNDNCVSLPIRGIEPEEAWVDALIDIACNRNGRLPPSSLALSFDARNIGRRVLMHYQMALRKG